MPSPAASGRRGVYSVPPADAPREEAGSGVPSEERTVVLQVFRDATRRRWRRACIGFAVVVVALAALAHVFVSAVQSSAAPNAMLDGQLGFDARAVASTAARAAAPPASFVADYAAASIPGASPNGMMATRVGWVDANDAHAAETLDAHGASLTDVVLVGLHGEDGTGDADDASRALGAARRHHLRVHELVTPTRERSDVGRFADATAARARADDVNGVVVDLSEGLFGTPPREDGEDRSVEAFLRSVKKALGTRDLGVLVAPGVDDSTLAQAGAVADRVHVRARIDPEGLAAPTPVAPRAWFRQTVAAVASLVPPAKISVMLPTRAAAWPVRAADGSSTATGRMLEWSDVVARCRVSGLRPAWDEASAQGVVALPGTGGVASSPLVDAELAGRTGLALLTWVPDAATVADELAALRGAGLGAVGLDDLGGEDPRVWSVIEARDRPATERALAPIPRPADWGVVGSGVEVRVLSEERDGEARVALASDGTVAAETYEVLPARTTVVQRAPIPQKTVVLTFDDGPDPEFTPRVLDVLRGRDVHATFFVIGSRVERDPEIVRRIAAEGHELGNHSFSHSDLSKLVDRRVDVELKATNLLLEATTGRTTLLFRPPYHADDVPTAQEDVVSVLAGQRNGISTIGSTIDPCDWNNPTTQQIIDDVVSHATTDDGGVVLLHDGGGDRSHTVSSLAPIIDTLRGRGFKFAQVRDLFGARSIDDVNPPSRTHFQQRVSQGVWFGGTWGLRAIQVVALIALLLGVVRVATLIVFALVDLRRNGRGGDRRLLGAAPRAVSVVVPAYNEAKVIERTISSVLASQGVDVEVIVLDDGSKDRTGDVVASRFHRDPRVRLVRLPNGGKAGALNLGFKLATHPVVVALDADTIFLPTTIFELVRRFDDERVAAVAGRAVVGNVTGTMARWQALEYVIGQAVERRAWHVFGLVSVVPGAVGAWRRDAVIEAGGFARDTLAEDSDLTIDLQVRGWRVDYAPDAVALTEAPETVRALVKQRYRWSYGVLQALWKHRKTAARTKNRRVGLFLLPTVLVAHLATPLFAPAADLAAGIALYLGYSTALIPFAIASLVFDLALTIFAMRLDRAPAKMAWDWILHRAVYRWILFFALVRAMFAALRGGPMGWGKLARTGTVRLPPQGATV
jgi:cellulose synthase/poly-beta-1,6-N-acetylglucosamine synthase-like glycosyltransferase/peptidoglycan/xylan/chitin deacetylase (PgdA/CDA1 family)